VLCDIFRTAALSFLVFSGNTTTLLLSFERTPAIEYFSPSLAPARNILKADIVFEKGLAEFDIAPAIK
jgi:hypothetical protein